MVSNDIEKKVNKILDLITALGFEMKEKSQNDYDHQLIQSSIDDIRLTLLTLSGLIE